MPGLLPLNIVLPLPSDQLYTRPVARRNFEGSSKSPAAPASGNTACDGLVGAPPGSAGISTIDTIGAGQIRALRAVGIVTALPALLAQLALHGARRERDAMVRWDAKNRWPKPSSSNRPTMYWRRKTTPLHMTTSSYGSMSRIGKAMHRHESWEKITAVSRLGAPW
jgi:hypothetical protein